MSEYDAQQLDMLEPAYLARFDLKQAPFSPALDERFFYLDADRAQRLDLIRQLVQDEELLLLVTGERGAGKTSLLQHFVRHASQHWRICQVDAHAMMDADQLLWRVAEGFHIGEPSRDPAVLEGMLYEHMAALHRSGLIPLLIVDNAHELPVDALAAIFRLADTETAEAEKLLRTVLFCEPQIEALLDSPALAPLRQHLSHQLQMPALSIEQTAEYLQHRLTAAGHGGDPLFSLKDIRRIQRAGAGLPGRINEQAHQLLNRRIGETTPGAGPSALVRSLADRPALLWAGLAVVAIGAVLVVVGRFHTPAQPPNESPATALAPDASGQEQITLALPATRSAGPRPTRLGAQSALASDRSAAARQPDSPEPDPASPPAPAQTPDTAPPAPAAAPQDEPAATGGPTQTSRATTLALSSVSPNPVPAGSSQRTITLSGRGFTPALRVSVNHGGQRATLAAGQYTLASDTRLVLHLAPGTAPATWTVTVTDPASGRQADTSFRVAEPANAKPASPAAQPAPAPAASGAGNAKLRGASWVLARDPAHFTLQLLSTHDAKAITAFVQRHALQGELARFHTVIQGQDWYTLVQGDFPNRAGAQASAQGRPADLRQLKPWIRRFGDVQGAIQRSTKTQAATPAPASRIPAPDIPNGHRPPPSAHDEAWLWSQDPSAYTLQLLATHQQANIARFIRAHHLEGKAVYFHSRRDGQDWYSLVYGVYPDRAHAAAAIKQLPADLQRAKPWARSFASVQSELAPVGQPAGR